MARLQETPHYSTNSEWILAPSHMNQTNFDSDSISDVSTFGSEQGGSAQEAATSRSDKAGKRSKAPVRYPFRTSLLASQEATQEAGNCKGGGEGLDVRIYGIRREVGTGVEYVAGQYGMRYHFTRPGGHTFVLYLPPAWRALWKLRSASSNQYYTQFIDPEGGRCQSVGEVLFHLKAMGYEQEVLKRRLAEGLRTDEPEEGVVRVGGGS